MCSPNRLIRGSPHAHSAATRLSLFTLQRTKQGCQYKLYSRQPARRCGTVKHETYRQPERRVFFCQAPCGKHAATGSIGLQVESRRAHSTSGTETTCEDECQREWRAGGEAGQSSKHQNVLAIGRGSSLLVGCKKSRTSKSNT